MFFFGPHIRTRPEAARLVALCDRDETRLLSAVEDLGGDVVGYGSMDSMLADARVDAVVITTPDFTHRELLDKALDAGKHVICEKPMATTLEDALHMARRAVAAPGVVQLGFMLRYAPFFETLKETVTSGVVGPLVQINAAEVVEQYHGAAFFRRWHRFRENSGGLLVHKACHTLDVINWLAGSAPSWIGAHGGTDTFLPRPGAASRCRDCSLASTCPAAYRPDEYNYVYQTREERADPSTHAADLCAYNSDKDSIDNAVVVAGYENGVRLAFSFATTGHRHERHLILVGQRGQIHASQADGMISVEPVGAEPRRILLQDDLRGEHGGGDERLVDSFLECVSTGKRPTADVVAGLHAVAMGVGATQSIDKSGQVVDLRPYLAGC
jgi:predicted dehydrogenase